MSKKKAKPQKKRTTRSAPQIGMPSTPTTLVTVPPQTIIEAPAETQQLCIDLACGQTPRAGFQGVDIVGGSNITQMDVLKYPWPWADNSVDKFHCSHFIEHIPAIEVDQHGNQVAYGAGQDALFRFFDEVWRVLKPDGLIEIIWPCSRSDRAFWDPTHRRYLPHQFVMYLNANWRTSQNLNHYNVHCNFIDSMNFTMDSALSALSDDAKTRHFNNYWNTIQDFWVRLRAIKPGSQVPDNQPPIGPFTFAQ